MTRFARAKGSKASNERIPNESTPWAIMKQELLNNLNNSKTEKDKKEMDKQKIANYKTFLREKEEEDSKHTVWASFPIQRNKSLLLDNKSKKSFKAKTVLTNDIGKVDSNKGKTKNIERKLKLVIDREKKMKDTMSEIRNTDNDSNNNVSNNKKKDKQNRKIDGNKSKNSDDSKVNNITKVHKKKSDKLKFEEPEETGSNDSNKIKVQNVNKKDNKKKKATQKKIEESGKHNNKKSAKKLKKEKAELTETDLKKIEKKKQKKIKQLLKKKMFKEKMKEQKENQEDQKINEKINPKDISTVVNESNNKKTTSEIVNVDETNNKDNSGKVPIKQKVPLKNKKKKNPDGDAQRRKQTMPHKMFINGKELEIAYVEGFPVKKEDAERLKKLRKEMISKGLPRSQIDTALKLERRRAEKALAREKKKVCFNCRKSGHNLSECPEIGKTELIETSGSGICFKCGSAEHTHFECKVVRGQEYKFAQCFICNEQGHIARQCPDNARGLYPKGGACRVCGDVTHLKKDCPKYQAQQEKQENHFRIKTLGDSNPEMLDSIDDTSGNRTFSSAKKQNKIIKFV